MARKKYYDYGITGQQFFQQQLAKAMKKEDRPDKDPPRSVPYSAS